MTPLVEQVPYHSYDPILGQGKYADYWMTAAAFRAQYITNGAQRCAADPWPRLIDMISFLRYCPTMQWSVETFNRTVDAEIEALPKDMRARLSRLVNVIEEIGFPGLPHDSVKHLEGKLWELRITGRDGISRDLRYRDRPTCGDRARVCKENPEDAAART